MTHNVVTSAINFKAQCCSTVFSIMCKAMCWRTCWNTPRLVSAAFFSMEVSMKRCIGFSRPGLRPPWYTHVATIEGEEFVKLSLQDTGFNRFVSGSTRGCKTMKWLDDFRKQRFLETLKLSADTESLFDEPPTAAARARQKRDCELKLKSGSLPATVQVHLPRIEYDGHVEAARSIKVVTAVDVGSCLQIECTDKAMQYVRVAMLASQGARKRTRRVSGTGSVSFLEDRNVFLARRSQNGKIKTKAFKVDDDVVNIAERKAHRWAAHDESHEDEDANGDDESHGSSDEVEPNSNTS